MTTVRRPPQFRVGDRALEAKRQVERQRYHVPPRPREAIPEVPDDITDLSDSDLIAMMTQLTRWSEHLGVQLAMAEVDERWLHAGLDKEKAIASLAGTGNVTERKARTYENDRVLEAEEQYHEAMAYRKLVEVLFDNSERWSALLSRELTRRVNRDPRERRTERYGT